MKGNHLDQEAIVDTFDDSEGAGDVPNVAGPGFEEL
jgi:hypothetical protein